MLYQLSHVRMFGFQKLEATPGFEPGVKALQASALPLGHVAILASCLIKSWLVTQPAHLRQWSGQRDSNPRPSPWQGDALPAEPCPHVWFSKVGGDARIRTGGEGFAGLCLTTWPRRHPGVLSYKELVSYPTSSSKTMERTTGFEPATLTLAR